NCARCKRWSKRWTTGVAPTSKDSKDVWCQDRDMTASGTECGRAVCCGRGVTNGKEAGGSKKFWPGWVATGSSPARIFLLVKRGCGPPEGHYTEGVRTRAGARRDQVPCSRRAKAGLSKSAIARRLQISRTSVRRLLGQA